jgi:hypothetical protein
MAARFAGTTIQGCQCDCTGCYYDRMNGATHACNHDQEEATASSRDSLLEAKEGGV